MSTPPSAGHTSMLPVPMRRGAVQKEPPGGVSAEPEDHGLGRSRGGFTAKIHLSCEQGQKPLSLLITAGQRGDSPQFEPVLNAIGVPRPGVGRGREAARCGCGAIGRTLHARIAPAQTWHQVHDS